MRLLTSLIDLYSLIVLAAVIMSWLPGARHNALGRIVYRLTEPVLAPIRRALPPIAGLDWSPLVLLLMLQLLKRLL